MKLVHFLILLLALSLAVDVDAGWKFWKKDKDKDKDNEDAEANSATSSTTSTTTTTTTTTTAPTVSTTSGGSWKFWKKKKDESTTAASKVTAATTPKPGPTQKPTAPSANRGIVNAADPGLAIGVGNTGSRIKEDARNQPRKPSPGTEVGLDIGQPKPVAPGLGGNTGKGYRDWAADLTGAGDSGRQSPKLPAQGPALSAGGQQPNQGNRPASVPGSPSGQPQVQPGTRPSSINGPLTGPQTPTGAQTPVGHQTPATPKPAAVPTPSTTVRSAQPTPQQRPTLAPLQPGHAQPKPGTPGSISPPGSPASISPPGSPGGASPPASPTGGKTWAEVAGGGSRSGSPTPAPKPGSPIPTRTGAGQRPFEYPSHPTPKPSTPQPSRFPSGAALAGGAAVGGAAAAAGAAGAASSTGSDKVFSSNPTYSKGKTVTDEDLEKLSEALFIKDTNNAMKYIKLNLQKTTNGNNPKDEAPEPLLEVKAEALQIPTIQKVLTIYDNYKLDTRENEYISPAQRQEESNLVDTFLSTNVMSAAMRFLADKGFIKKDYYEYKDTLRAMWFNLYSRGEGKIGSTGFEHVFLTELKLGTEVSGLHNWIYFNSEELKKKLDYLGYIKKVDLGNKAAIVKAHVKFNGIDKPVTNIFIGTSPELEMALYTVCFYARADTQCPVSLGGTKFNIITHKFRYRGRDLIGSAYPEI